MAALRLLDGSALLEAAAGRGRGSRRRVADRDRLLASYAAAVAARRRPLSIRVGGVWRDMVDATMAVGRAWSSAGVSWAATGLVASMVLAPFASNVSTGEVYVAGRLLSDLARAAALAGLAPVDGGRLLLSVFPTAATGRLVEEVGGMLVAPWPRVFADLRMSGVRGEDVAEHLREVCSAA